MTKHPEMTYSSSFLGRIKPIGFHVFKDAFCDLETCSSARAGRGNKMRTLAVNPVNTMYARYLTEMLGVMGNYGQPKMTSSNSYKNIELANSQTLGCKSVTYFNVIVNPIFYNGKNLKVLLNDLRFSKMLLDILTMYGPISKFRNRDFRSKDFILGCLRNMCPHTTALVEKFNPRVRVNNKTFHSGLIIKVYFTVKWTTIIAMLHHLVVFFALSILRPNAFHLQKLFQRLVLRCDFFILSRHNQLICQPLTITLRE